MANVFIPVRRAAVMAGAVLALATSPPARAESQTVGSIATNRPAGTPPQAVGSNATLFGNVKLEREHRRASFPATINQRTGVVEYAVVTASGKTHESLFRTQAEPQQLHLALLLLGVKPAYSNFFPADLSSPLPGDRVSVEVTWRDSGREVRRPL